MKAMTIAPSKNAPTTHGQSVRTFGRCEILVIGISPRVHELSIAEPFLVYGARRQQSPDHRLRSTEGVVNFAEHPPGVLGSFS